MAPFFGPPCSLITTTSLFRGSPDGGWLSGPKHCSKAVHPMPKLHIEMAVTRTQLPLARLEPGCSHFAASHVTTRLLQPDVALRHVSFAFDVGKDNRRKTRCFYCATICYGGMTMTFVRYDYCLRARLSVHPSDTWRCCI